ncbi:hypothetical protein GCM10023191_088490 [Actinoallomurus oryzae]|uniref:Urease domain-containing protein n=2 Tax=Actinoallomurus oryzae TaxID=502180 RepID=A0ABP8R3B4_9ACTN
MAAMALFGDPNAAVPTPQPRLCYDTRTRAAATSVAFVAPAAIEDGPADRLAVERELVAVKNMRGRTKADPPANDALPAIEVDADTFAVRGDGEEVDHEPAAVLPMTQHHLLF